MKTNKISLKSILGEIEYGAGKKLQDEKLTVDSVNPYELAKGIKIEMESTDDPEKAEEKAVENLGKDPAYYTNLMDWEAQHKFDESPGKFSPKKKEEEKDEEPKEVKSLKLNQMVKDIKADDPKAEKPRKQ